MLDQIANVVKSQVLPKDARDLDPRLAGFEEPLDLKFNVVLRCSYASETEMQKRGKSQDTRYQTVQDFQDTKSPRVLVRQHVHAHSGRLSCQTSRKRLANDSCGSDAEEAHFHAWAWSASMLQREASCV